MAGREGAGTLGRGLAAAAVIAGWGGRSSVASDGATALAVGLKVDAERLPARLREQLRRGVVDLDDPATTVALLRLGAVVGIEGYQLALPAPKPPEGSYDRALAAEGKALFEGKAS